MSIFRYKGYFEPSYDHDYGNDCAKLSVETIQQLAKIGDSSKNKINYGRKEKHSNKTEMFWLWEVQFSCIYYHIGEVRLEKINKTTLIIEKISKSFERAGEHCHSTGNFEWASLALCYLKLKQIFCKFSPIAFQNIGKKRFTCLHEETEGTKN